MNREELRAKAAGLPRKPGVYLMKSAPDEEIYVGKAKDLRARVKTYFDPSGPTDDKTMALLTEVVDFDWIETSSEVEAFLLENRLVKDLQPKYNIDLKSGSGYPYLEITWGDDFPRARVTRDRRTKGSRYYGPFVEARALRSALRVLQRVFRFRSCNREMRAGDPRLRFNRPCLNHHIGRCTAPCSGRVSRGEYRKAMKRLGMFVSGSAGAIVADLQRLMKTASARMDFEKAAAYRDEIRALESLARRGDLSDGIEPEVPILDPVQGMQELSLELGLSEPPSVIEGVDIANLGDEDKVGSVVTFAGGAPERGGYRRFRIKTVSGADDVASMREVLTRRYGRMLREGERLPDVVLLDGGLGQLNAAERVLAELGIGPPRSDRPVLAALAKKEEVVRTIGHPEGLGLTRRSPALRLLQYIRDEAHRFAQHYHHILRRKRVLQEDD